MFFAEFWWSVILWSFFCWEPNPAVEWKSHKSQIHRLSNLSKICPHDRASSKTHNLSAESEMVWCAATNMGSTTSTQPNSKKHLKRSQNIGEIEVWVVWMLSKQTTPFSAQMLFSLPQSQKVLPKAGGVLLYVPWSVFYADSSWQWRKLNETSETWKGLMEGLPTYWYQL